MKNHGSTPRSWWIYILDCDGRLYTGVTTDPERRLREHRAGRTRAARFTRGATSAELRYAVAVGGRSLALQAEWLRRWVSALSYAGRHGDRCRHRHGLDRPGL